jgi:hypothetical protein
MKTTVSKVDFEVFDLLLFSLNRPDSRGDGPWNTTYLVSLVPSLSNFAASIVVGSVLETIPKDCSISQDDESIDPRSPYHVNIA